MIIVGYWAFRKYENDPYVQGEETEHGFIESGLIPTTGAAPYLETAIGWARSTGLKVWIDLHGGPGSQNGLDNSGQRTDNPQFQQGNTVQHALDVLEQISQQYAAPEYQDVVVAIEVLNEPLPPKIDLGGLRDFYRQAFNEIRETSDTPVVLSDAFQPPSFWNGFLTPSDNNAQNVIIDHHEYQVFSPGEVSLSRQVRVDCLVWTLTLLLRHAFRVIARRSVTGSQDIAAPINGQS